MTGYRQKFGSKSIGVEYITPLRKKPCLMIQDGCVSTKVASFNNEESARMFFDFMAELFQLQPIDWNSDDIPIGLRKDWNDGKDTNVLSNA